jgi:alkylation response protein AidB-like acyl-CoA dehydrogenase
MIQTASAAVQETVAALTPGAGFLLEPVGTTPFLTPEQFTPEQHEFYRTAVQFLEHEVLPRTKEIEAKTPGLMQSLLQKAGELGFLMIDIPEEYGGLGGDKTTSMLFAEASSRNGSWAVSMGAHTGIGTLPIVFFGNELQKRKYLPKLATGEWLSAYALTEANSGSDALAAKTRADLSPDGKHYILNGSKMWITNAAFADVYIVFAKIDGDKFTGFIVDRTAPGLSVGPEEHKMGIRGSSTCALTFEDCKIPAENLLGEPGKGHKIAFNILNVGRFKLGVGTLGAAKNALRISVAYARERKQFGQPLSDFGLIKAKIGSIAEQIFAVESMAYRLSGLMDARIGQIPKGAPDYQNQVVQAIEEYVIEASTLKIAGSELLDFAADEAIQIHGGYGYSEEYAPERIARDSRINRIFEGTNEINRMLIPGTLLKRAMKGQLPLMDAIGRLQAELGGQAPLPLRGKGPLGAVVQLTELAKRAALYSAQVVVQKYMAELAEQQEILAALADLVISVYGMDSAVGRALEIEAHKGPGSLAEHMAMLYAHETYDRVMQLARVTLESISEGEELEGHRQSLSKLTVPHALPRIRLRRSIADACIEAGGYTL